jgi:ATP-dependent DNA helicase RecG
MKRNKNYFMEKAGTGIKRVTDACNINGNACSFSFSDAFWVKMKSNVTDNVTDNVTNNRLDIILEFIKNDNTITTEEIAKKMDVSKRTILRDIDKLKTQNKIERIGNTKTGHWKMING